MSYYRRYDIAYTGLGTHTLGLGLGCKNTLVRVRANQRITNFQNFRAEIIFGVIFGVIFNLKCCIIAKLNLKAEQFLTEHAET